MPSACAIWSTGRTTCFGFSSTSARFTRNRPRVDSLGSVADVVKRCRNGPPLPCPLQNRVAGRAGRAQPSSPHCCSCLLRLGEHGFGALSPVATERLCCIARDTYAPRTSSIVEADELIKATSAPTSLKGGAASARRVRTASSHETRGLACGSQLRPVGR